MTFKASRGQLAQRDTLAHELRRKAKILNTAIAAFNRDVEQLSRALAEARADYNQTLEMARALTGNVAEAAQQEFDAKSEKWQDGEKGQRVREWIEQWEMSLDDIDLEALDREYFSAMCAQVGLDPKKILELSPTPGPERILDLAIRIGPFGDRYGERG